MTDALTAPLLPCPFCGASADAPEITGFATGAGEDWQIDCTGCGAHLIAIGEDGVRGAWNRREEVTIRLPKYAVRYLRGMCEREREALATVAVLSLQSEASYDSLNQIEYALPDPEPWEVSDQATT